MCGIIGLFNDPHCARNLLRGMSAIQQRGKDQYGIATPKQAFFASRFSELSFDFTECHAVGHCLHAVQGFVREPFANRGKLVANCEIYNWRELAQKSNPDSKPKNDAEFLFFLLEQTSASAQKIVSAVRQLDGDFAFAYWRNNSVYLFRDRVGVKPLWFACDTKRFGFASEAKALRAMGFENVFEQNPREYIRYNLKTRKLIRTHAFEFKAPAAPGINYSDDSKAVAKLEQVFLASVQKRIPGQKFGILFSGGLDSVLLAKACLKLGATPKLFFSAIGEEVFGKPADFPFAQQAAQELGLELIESHLCLPDAQQQLSRIVPLIESSDVTKAGVALTLAPSIQTASRTKTRILFSGLGADELFAGYSREATHSDRLADETVSYLRKAYEKDLYRDDVLAMQHSVELRVPYYDKGLIAFALSLSDKAKISGNTRKQILRKLAAKWGITGEIALREKKAAQYGSNADKAIAKLARQGGFSSKSQFLDSILKHPNLRLGCLCSGGKDSWLAALVMKQKNYDLKCLIALQSHNPHSYLFHTPNISLVKLQSKASQIPLVLQSTAGKPETELQDLRKALQTAQAKFKLDGIVTGALFSNYQRSRIETTCDELGLKVFSPLWHTNPNRLLEALFSNQFEVVFSSIAAAGLDQSWLGKSIFEQKKDLLRLEASLGLNIAGEGGEFETLVLDCPLFTRRIEIQHADIQMENECTGIFRVTKAALCTKHPVIGQKILTRSKKNKKSI